MLRTMVMVNIVASSSAGGSWKPSAIREYGRLYKNPFGLDPKIVNKTLEEAAYMRRKRITITTFMLAVDAPLLEFVRKLTERARRGRGGVPRV